MGQGVKLKILLLTQILPYPPDSGPKVKTHHVLRYLSERGHHVTLASFVRREEEKYVGQLEMYCDAVHRVPLRRDRSKEIGAFVRSLHAGLPFLVTRDDRREMHTLINRLVREQSFDIVHADQLGMVQYALAGSQPQRLGKESHVSPVSFPSLVFDAHNAVWTIVRRSQQNSSFLFRPLLAYEARRLRTYEGAVCREMDAVLAVTEADKRSLIEAGADGSKITVIPIAVDSSSLRQFKSDSKSRNILTISTLFYPPNADGIRWFIRHVLPQVRNSAPEATFTIVGPRPPKDIVQFASRNSQYASATGYVPDLRPYLERATVMIVPLRAASGMRVRILEALARGIPVVTTTTGVEGVDAVNGEHLLIADDPGQFAHSVTCLLNDEGLRRRLAENGRRLIQDKYDWKVALPRLEQVYLSITTN